MDYDSAQFVQKNSGYRKKMFYWATGSSLILQQQIIGTHRWASASA